MILLNVRQGVASFCVSCVAASVLMSSGRAQEPDFIRRDPVRVVRAQALRQAIAQGLPYVPGEVLVRFATGTAPARATGALSVLRTSMSSSNARWIGEVLHLTGLSNVDAVRAAEDLARQPEVIYAQPNYLMRRTSVPNDPGYGQQWNLPAINAPQAWDINRAAAAGVTVAVIDGGLTTTDGQFPFRIWTGTGFGIFQVPFAKADDFDHARVLRGVDLQLFGGWVSPAGEPLVFDAGGHGTHVSGTIAQQTNNGSGFAGLASGATLLPIKACFEPWDAQLANGYDGVPLFVSASFSGCETSAIVEGIRYAADQGAKVINLSLGGPSPTPAILEALQYAVGRGTFVAIAAGNEALEGNPVDYPSFYAPSIDGVMSVAAVTRSRQRALYSTFGSYVEIAAPGGAGSFGPASEQIFQIGPNQSDLSIFRPAPAFTRYGTQPFSGTSMAAPHVSALAALLYSQGVTSPAAIEAAIKRFAIDLGNPGRDDDFGYGLIDARATLRGLGIKK